MIASTRDLRSRNERALTAFEEVAVAVVVTTAVNTSVLCVTTLLHFTEDVFVVGGIAAVTTCAWQAVSIIFTILIIPK